jgi:hypothetical protein
MLREGSGLESETGVMLALLVLNGQEIFGADGAG